MINKETNLTQQSDFALTTFKKHLPEIRTHWAITTAGTQSENLGTSF